MKKRNYLHPVTKKLTLEMYGAVCTEPPVVISVEPMYGGPMDDEDPEPMF